MNIHVIPRLDAILSEYRPLTTASEPGLQRDRATTLAQASVLVSKKMNMTDQGILNTEEQNRLLAELEMLNERMRVNATTLRFRLHQETDHYYVELVDLRSQEVIDTLPPEYMLDLAAQMQELISIFIDERI